MTPLLSRGRAHPGRPRRGRTEHPQPTGATFHTHHRRGVEQRAVDRRTAPGRARGPTRRGRRARPAAAHADRGRRLRRTAATATRRPSPPPTAATSTDSGGTRWSSTRVDGGEPSRPRAAARPPSERGHVAPGELEPAALPPLVLRRARPRASPASRPRRRRRARRRRARRRAAAPSGTRCPR